MKLRRQAVVVLLLVIALAVEGSVLLRDSYLRPRKPEPCFTCKASERPFAYPLIVQLGKLKDIFVKVFKNIMTSAKEYKLENKQ